MLQTAADLWVYQARILRVVDGDTLDAEVDLGFYTTRTIRLRLQNVDTAEVYGVGEDTEEFETGVAHADFVREWIDEGEAAAPGEWPFIVLTRQTGKYGRYLAFVTRRADGADLSADLIETFPAVENR